MEIITLPKGAFDFKMMELLNTEIDITKIDIALISIISTEDKDVEGRSHLFRENHTNVLNLIFDDVEHDIDGTRAFTNEQAVEVINFIDSNINKNLFIIHCGAGVSRSGAIATFLNDYLGQNYEDFKRKNPHIHPNGQVLAQLKRIIREKLDNFELQYVIDHEVCPKCHTVNYTSTEAYYPPNPIHLLDYKDKNRVECSCGFKGIVHDLISY